MNKKFLTVGFLCLFAIGLVSAVAYYAVFSATFTVNPSITILGDVEQELGEVYSGDTLIGDELTVTNNAPSDREVELIDDSDDDVEVSYLSELILSQKLVDFSSTNWELTGDTATVRYTLIGDEFNAEITSGELEGYVLVYYKDNSDRFNSPAQVITLDAISSNLPYESDKNADEYDYCATGEYATCHGAKLWYVPQNAITGTELDWSRASEFYFETSLIQYNQEGNLVLYPGMSLQVLPQYTIGSSATGEKTITTQIV